MNKLDRIVFRFVFELVFTVGKVVLFFGFRIYLGLFKIFVGTDADRITFIVLVIIYYIRKGSGYDNLALKCIINAALICYVYGKSFKKMIGEKVENMPVVNNPENPSNNGSNGTTGGKTIDLSPIKETVVKAKDETKKNMYLY